MELTCAYRPLSLDLGVFLTSMVFSPPRSIEDASNFFYFQTLKHQNTYLDPAIKLPYLILGWAMLTVTVCLAIRDSPWTFPTISPPEPKPPPPLLTEHLYPFPAPIHTHTHMALAI